MKSKKSKIYYLQYLTYSLTTHNRYFPCQNMSLLSLVAESLLYCQWSLWRAIKENRVCLNSRAIEDTPFQVPICDREEGILAQNKGRTFDILIKVDSIFSWVIVKMDTELLSVILLFNCMFSEALKS